MSEADKMFEELEKMNMKEELKEMNKFLNCLFIAFIIMFLVLSIYIDGLETKNETIQERYNQVQEEKQLLLEQNTELENRIKELE